MLIKPYAGIAPEIDPTARVAETAVLVGDVHLEKEASVWYGAVLRADAAAIRVGKGSNVQDNCVIHCDAGMDVVIGERVVVGHGAILHSCVIGDACMIGMGAILLNGCEIGAGSIIGAGAVIGEHKKIPAGSLVVGVPGRVVKEIPAEAGQAIIAAADAYVSLSGEQFPPEQVTAE